MQPLAILLLLLHYNRFKQILVANPWLCGRLVEQNKEVMLSYEQQQQHNTKDYIRFVTVDTLFQLDIWSAIWDLVWQHVPKLGAKCVGRDERLCGLTMFRNTPGDEVAVMFSMNHTIGDGTTFYTIWKMLDLEQPVVALDPHRIHSVEGMFGGPAVGGPCIEGRGARHPRAVGSGAGGRGARGTGAEGSGVEGSGAGDLGGCVGTAGDHSAGMWLHKAVELGAKAYGGKHRRKLVQIFTAMVNNETLLKIKEELNDDECFVSTNDVLCSWLFSSCKGTSQVYHTNQPFIPLPLSIFFYLKA